MKALIFDKSKTDWETSRGFELVDIPEPTIDETKNSADADYVIIKVHYAGVCGTDRGLWYRQVFKDAVLNSIDEESKVSVIASAAEAIPSKEKIASSDALLAMTKKSYRIIGHEFFGEVIKVGSNVKNIHTGDMVTCESHVVDNKCYQCLHGQKNVCTNEKILGISHDGGFAEFAKVPAHIVWKTDVSKIRPEVAAMQEPFGNAVHAGSKVDLKGKTIAIFGLGPIGSFLVLVAKGLGAKQIIGVDLSDKALEMGKSLGVDNLIKLAVNSTVIARSASDEAISSNDKIASAALAMTVKGYAHDQKVVDEIKKLTNGLGVDVAFEMAGFNDSVNNAIFSTRRGGDVILFGIKNGDFVFEDYNSLIAKGITIYSVIGRQIWETWEITKKLMEAKDNGVQEKLFDVILQGGNSTILNINDYSKEKFEEMMKDKPKFLIKF